MNHDNHAFIFRNEDDDFSRFTVPAASVKSFYARIETENSSGRSNAYWIAIDGPSVNSYIYTKYSDVWKSSLILAYMNG